MTRLKALFIPKIWMQRSIYLISFFWTRIFKGLFYPIGFLRSFCFHQVKHAILEKSNSPTTRFYWWNLSKNKLIWYCSLFLGKAILRVNWKSGMLWFLFITWSLHFEFGQCILCTNGGANIPWNSHHQQMNTQYVLIRNTWH